MQNSMAIPQKVKIELAYDLVTLLLGISLREMKSIYQTHIRTPCLFQKWKQSKFASADKENVIHTHNGLLLRHISDDILSFAAS